MDWMQLSSSLIAIVLLAFAAHKMFPAPKGLTNERVLRNYRRYSPDAEPGVPIISEDAQSAILPIATPSDELGIITQLGDRVVCRSLNTSQDLEWRISGETLTLKHGDYTQPSVDFVFSPDDLTRAQEVIDVFSNKGHVHAA